MHCVCLDKTTDRKKRHCIVQERAHNEVCVQIMARCRCVRLCIRSRLVACSRRTLPCLDFTLRQPFGKWWLAAWAMMMMMNGSCCFCWSCVVSLPWTDFSCDDIHCVAAVADCDSAASLVAVANLVVLEFVVVAAATSNCASIGACVRLGRFVAEDSVSIPTANRVWNDPASSGQRFRGALRASATRPCRPRNPPRRPVQTPCGPTVCVAPRWATIVPPP
mmetsp:Transcript_17728/g.38629  ORF Transcript_17728/g.38629 Transcript_17728/m.38629 type:complete len:220 (-) Transcript_17728:2067-2726(-)